MANYNGYVLDVITGYGQSGRAPLGFIPQCNCPPSAFTPLTDTPRSSVPPGTADMGVDVDAVQDVPLRWALCNGYRNLGNALARRVLFLKDYLNAGLTQEQINQLQGRVSTAVAADPRVQSVSKVQLLFSLSAQTMTCNIWVQTAGGPFGYVMKVSALTVDVLDLRIAQ